MHDPEGIGQTPPMDNHPGDKSASTPYTGRTMLVRDNNQMRSNMVDITASSIQLSDRGDIHFGFD